MDGMFSYANAFSGGDLTGWDTSNVVRMTYIFYGAGLLTADISTRNVSSVSSFDKMFLDSFVFEGDLSKWDTSNAVSMEGMVSVDRTPCVSFATATLIRAELT